MTEENTVDGSELDVDAIRQKYAEEREKRIRSDGQEQYVEVVDDFAGFYENDPWTAPIEREPVNEDVDVVVLGGGFAGLVAGARIREQGVENFRILDMAGDFGGTWYWNRYPGVQCDIESYCYLPLLDELGYVPKHKYSYGDEIYEYCRLIGRHFRLYEAALFQTMVTALRWDESLERWRITTNRGDELRTRFLTIALGPYNRPKLPGIPGIETFRGHMFHTSRWDYDYTGGGRTGGLTGLRNRTVAIIGTGATGVQCVPYVAPDAKHLYVFQRTPSVVDVRNNALTDQEWANNLKPGWARERRDNFNAMIGGGIKDDMVGDGWTAINRRVVAQVTPEMPISEVAKLREAEDFKRMEELRARVDSIVSDHETAELLKAWYRWGCKRPTFNDQYLQAFNRDNVTLVDVSKSQGVEQITEDGIVADGVKIRLDCIIFASGFEIAGELRRRYGIDTIEGRNGVSLYDHWKDGFKTLHGFTTHGFPNLFFVGFYQGGVSANVTSMFDDQSRHIAYIIGEALRRDAQTVEPTQEAQDEWVDTLRSLAISRDAFFADCTPGYYNDEGKGRPRFSHLGEVYSPGINAFNALMQEWREQSDLRGLVLTK